ncbi:hypothetical protein N9Y89_02070 [bacterium]|nr:hypothetical protein [bacterium]
MKALYTLEKPNLELANQKIELYLYSKDRLKSIILSNSRLFHYFNGNVKFMIEGEEEVGSRIK